MAKRYRTAEVCRLLDLQPYVLRYWATEFPGLEIAGTGTGAQASYGEAELAKLRRIKQLLYDEGYTIAGARKKLESEPLAAEGDVAAPLFAPEPEESAEPVRRAKRTPAARLDTSDDERIKSLERGLTEVLGDARELLARIERGR